MNPDRYPAATPANDRRWVAGQTGLMLGVVAAGICGRGTWHSGAAFLAGAVFFALGAVVGVWGVRSLGRSRTPNPTPKTDGQLVQEGLYRWLRHPLYSSVMLASLGWALVWQSAAALVAGLLLSIFFDAKARLEERLLLEKFPEYEAYRERTWKFVPWVY